MFLLLAIHAIGRHERNIELIWNMMIGFLLVAGTAMLFPALGYPGWIGEEHIRILIEAREGIVRAPEGIITFPSYHAVVGVVLAYSARGIRPLFWLLAPLNGLLLLATPPAGGHYMVDVIAGVIIAAVTIAIVQRLLALRTRTWLSSIAPSGQISQPESYAA